MSDYLSPDHLPLYMRQAEQHARWAWENAEYRIYGTVDPDREENRKMIEHIEGYLARFRHNPEPPPKGE